MSDLHKMAVEETRLEFKRLNAEIARLRAIVKAYEEGSKNSAYLTAQSVKDQAKQNGELIRLRTVNAALLKALRWIEDHSNDPGVVREARAAIALAKGEKT